MSEDAHVILHLVSGACTVACYYFRGRKIAAVEKQLKFWKQKAEYGSYPDKERAFQSGFVAGMKSGAAIVATFHHSFLRKP